jgi:hypothetical protein
LPEDQDEEAAEQADTGKPDPEAKPKRASNGQKPVKPESGPGESNGGGTS